MRLLRDPITQGVPLFVMGTNELTMNDIAKGTFLPDSNLSPTSQILYNSISGDKFVLNGPINSMVTDGLVLALDAGSVISYPRNGSSWKNLNSVGGNGLLTNGPTFDSIGAIDFDGVDDRNYIDLSTLPKLTSLTFNCWIKSDITHSSILNSTPVLLHFRGAGFYLRGDDGSASGYLNWNPVPVSGIWQMLTCTWDGSTMKSYINNTKQSDERSYDGGTSGELKIFPNTTQIGGYFNTSQPWTNGRISSAYLYNRELSQSEINQNYYQAPIVTDGLVFAVDAGNLVSYESGSTTAYSLTGSIDGTLTNNVEWNNDSGGTFDFDGVDDFINFGNANQILSDTFCTIECWMKSSDDGTGSGGNATFIGTRVGRNAMLCKGNNQAKFLWDTTTEGNVSLVGTSNVFDQEWHHIVGVFNNGLGSIYVDGEFENSTTSTAPLDLNANDFGMGADPRNLTRTFYGQVSIGRVYNKALTADEVSQNYNANINRFN
jgi:hypothetical protein